MDYHYYIGVAAMVVGALTWVTKQPWSGAVFTKIPKKWRWIVPAALGALATGFEQYQHGANAMHAVEVALGTIALPIAGHQVLIEGLIAAAKSAKGTQTAQAAKGDGGGNSSSP